MTHVISIEKRNQNIDIEQRSHSGYPSALPPWAVLRRVRSLIGTPYRLFDWNCDHVVAAVHGRKPESPQLVATAVIAAVVALVLTVSSR